MRKVLVIFLLIVLIWLAMIFTTPLNIAGAFNFCLFCFPFPLIMIPILFLTIYLVFKEDKNNILLLLCFITSIAISLISYYNWHIISPFTPPPVKPDELIENLSPMSIYSFITNFFIAFCLCGMCISVFF